MIRQLALGLGLVLVFCGMIVFLIIISNLDQVLYYQDGYYIGAFGYVSHFVFSSFVAFGVASMLTGFSLLCLGILFPHQTPESASEEDIVKE
jgi:uncharacterized membrane protein